MDPHSTKLDSPSQSNNSTVEKALNDLEDGAGSDIHLEGSPKSQTLEEWNLTCANSLPSGVYYWSKFPLK